MIDLENEPSNTCTKKFFMLSFILMKQVIRLSVLHHQRRYWRNSHDDKILNECRQAKERIAALFGDVDTLMDFLMKRRE